MSRTFNMLVAGATSLMVMLGLSGIAQASPVDGQDPRTHHNVTVSSEQPLVVFGATTEGAPNITLQNGTFKTLEHSESGDIVAIVDTNGEEHSFAPTITDNAGNSFNIKYKYVNDNEVVAISADPVLLYRDGWDCAAGYAGLIVAGVAFVAAPKSIPVFAGLLGSGVGAAAGCHDLWK